MTIKKRKIGRGLSSLLGDITFSEIENQINERLSGGEQPNGESSLSTFNVVDIPIEQIDVNPHQPRKTFDKESISELSESIKERGVLQPILVEESVNGVFVIIAGERRYRASKAAGLKTMPCIVRNFSETERYVVSMIENVQRSNLNPMEEALGYKTMFEEYGLSHAEIAKMVGKSRAHITNMIGILNMPEQVHEMLSTREISTGHAKVLRKVSNANEITKLAKKVKEDSLSVRALEQHISSLTDANAENKHKNEATIKSAISFNEDDHSWNTITPQEILAMEDAFNASFSQMIHIQHSVDGSGKIIVHYTDIEELRGVMSKMIDLADVYTR